MLSPAICVSTALPGKTMLCLACHEGRLATLLESATELRFHAAESEGYRLRETCAWSGADTLRLADTLVEKSTRILICGGLTGCCQAILERRNVMVLPWIAGNVEQVLAAYARGRLANLAMPGFRKPRRRGCRAGRCLGVQDRVDNHADKEDDFDEDSHQHARHGPEQPA